MAIQVINVTGEPLSIGRAVKISWKNPVSQLLKEVVVHRRVDEFCFDPLSLNSIEIYRGNAETVYDYLKDGPAVTDIKNIPEYNTLTDEQKEDWLVGEKLYYYTIFTVDINDVYNASYGTSVAVSPTTQYNMGNWLYNQLPPVYRLEDKGLELKRFCELIGEQLDYLYSMITMAKNLNNPSKVNPAHMHLLAKMLGWELDRTISLINQRRTLQNAVTIYRYAGTKIGLDALVKYYSGFPTTSGIFEGNEKIFRSVLFGIESSELIYEEHQTPDFTDGTGTDFSKVGTAQDTLEYMWDFSQSAQVSSNSFTAYVQKTSPITEEQEAAITERLTRVLSKFIPVGAQFQILIY